MQEIYLSAEVDKFDYHVGYSLIFSENNEFRGKVPQDIKKTYNQKIVALYALYVALTLCIEEVCIYSIFDFESFLKEDGYLVCKIKELMKYRIVKFEKISKDHSKYIRGLQIIYK